MKALNWKMIVFIIQDDLYRKNKAFIYILGLIILSKFPLNSEIQDVLLLLLSIPLLIVFLGNFFGSANRQNATFNLQFINNIYHDKMTAIAGEMLSGVAVSGLTLLLLAVSNFSIDGRSINELKAYFPCLLLVAALFRVFTLRIIIAQSRGQAKHKGDEKRSVQLLISLRICFIFSAFITFLVFSLAFILQSEFENILNSFLLCVVLSVVLSWLTFQTHRIWVDDNRRVLSNKLNIFPFIAIALLIMFFSQQNDETEVISVIKSGDISRIKELDKHDKITNENLKTSGYSPLMYSLFLQQNENSKYFIRKSVKALNTLAVSPENKFYDGKNSYFIILVTNNLEILKYIESVGVKIEDLLFDDKNALMLAMEVCDPEMLKYLASNSELVKYKDTNERTAIFYTSKGHGCLTGFKLLKDSGLGTNTKLPNGVSVIEYIKEKNPRFYKELSFFELI